MKNYINCHKLKDLTIYQDILDEDKEFISQDECEEGLLFWEV